MRSWKKTIGEIAAILFITVWALGIGVKESREDKGVWEKEFYHCADALKEAIETMDASKVRLPEYDEYVRQRRRQVYLNIWQDYMDFVDNWVEYEGRTQEEKEDIYRTGTLLMVLVGDHHTLDGRFSINHRECYEFIYDHGATREELLCDGNQALGQDNPIDKGLVQLEEEFEGRDFYGEVYGLTEEAWEREFLHCMEMFEGMLSDRTKAYEGYTGSRETLDAWRKFIEQWADGNEKYAQIDAGSGLSIDIALGRMESYRTATLLMISFLEQYCGEYKFIYDIEKEREKMAKLVCHEIVGVSSTGETNMPNGRMDGTSVYFSKTIYYNPSEELVEYFVKALEDGKLLERIEDIGADYEILGEAEKAAFDLPEEERGIGLALYYPDVKDCNWYRVSLTEEGDDIIVEYVREDGCKVNFMFWNIKQWHKYTDVPLWAGGQRGSTPYFIRWEDKNYMAIPYWDAPGESIIGVTIYEFDSNYGGGVIAVGMNSDSTISVILQCYETSYSEGATKWPVVVSY